MLIPCWMFEMSTNTVWCCFEILGVRYSLKRPNDDPIIAFTGHYVWTGDWSDNSDKWTPDLRVELLPDGPLHDGTFWISFNDVLKYFDCIDICKARSGWNEIRMSGILPPLASQQHLSCILLTVLEPTEVDFTLFQVNQLSVMQFLTCLEKIFVTRALIIIGFTLILSWQHYEFWRFTVISWQFARLGSFIWNAIFFHYCNSIWWR